MVWRKTYFEDNIFHWISIELLLNNPGSSFFFAFGAGHFVGDHTIIDVVRRAGFTVEPVMTGDDVDNWVTNNYDTNQSGEDEEESIRDEIKIYGLQARENILKLEVEQ